MEENKELETVTESQRNAGKGLFLSGIIVGFAATLLVVGGIFIAFQIHRIVTVKDDVSAQVSYDEDSAVNAQTIKKLQLLEDTVKENFYLSEVTNEQLEDGMYRGLMEALDDPYSEYYTAEELNELTEQTQGIYYGIGAYVSMDSDTNLPKISGVIEGAPAADVDLRANDIIYELVRTEQYRADFTVLRDGQTVELPDVQFDTWTDEAGQVHMSLGFTVYGLAKTPRNVLREAGNSMLYYGRIIFTSLADLLRGRENINNLSGPVGIVTAIGQAASYGWQDLLQLLALITINLGIFNLLPFPALDGGKVVFLAIEGITGHAVPEKLQGSLTVAAFALLFGLMIFATYNDIIRLITGAV